MFNRDWRFLAKIWELIDYHWWLRGRECCNVHERNSQKHIFLRLCSYFWLKSWSDWWVIAVLLRWAQGFLGKLDCLAETYSGCCTWTAYWNYDISRISIFFLVALGRLNSSSYIMQTETSLAMSCLEVSKWMHSCID